MEKNATIKATLGDLLEILDARAYINVFVENADEDQTSVAYCRVYEFITDDGLMDDYKDLEVIGLNCGLPSTNILIKEV